MNFNDVHFGFNSEDYKYRGFYVGPRARQSEGLWHAVYEPVPGKLEGRVVLGVAFPNAVLAKNACRAHAELVA